MVKVKFYWLLGGDWVKLQKKKPKLELRIHNCSSRDTVRRQPRSVANGLKFMRARVCESRNWGVGAVVQCFWATVV